MKKGPEITTLSAALARIQKLEKEIDILTSVAPTGEATTRPEKTFPKSKRQLKKWLINSDPRDWYRYSRIFRDWKWRNDVYNGWLHKPTNMIVSYFKEYGDLKAKLHIGSFNPDQPAISKLEFRLDRKLKTFIEAIKIGGHFREEEE